MGQEDKTIVHELKTVQPYYDDVKSGNKTFEVRKNDRPFRVNDYLILKEYDPITNTYSGKEIMKRISYILDSKDYCKDGYVIMGMKSTSKRCREEDDLK